jgi:3'-phosphoadenosine 5'-phosphosulfate sulfotransferase (PAPS reductase)/FAD synthetase
VAAILGKKQSLSSQAIWLEARRRAAELDIRPRIDETIQRIRETVGHRDLAFGWSGGKDSIVLEKILALAGYRACVLVITQLEYRAFLQWATDHMPERLTVIRTHHDLDWLARNEEMLFPKDAAIAARWFHQVQHWGQEVYLKRERFDLLAVGRRRKDGNYCGRDGIYTNARGITRYAPLADWTHEEVFAAIEYFQAALPPNYSWPRGYQVGTGPWAARQFASTQDQAWREVWEIEPGIVEAAATRLESAREWMRDGRLRLGDLHGGDHRRALSAP